MLTLPTAFSTAAAKSGHEPIWLVELPAIGTYYATHPLDFKRTWRIGEGLYMGGGWQLGDVRDPYDGRIAEGGLGRISRSLDDAGQIARIGGLSVRLANTDDIGATLSDLALDNTPVRVLMGYRDLTYNSYVLLYQGVVDNVEETYTLLTLDVIDDTLRAHRSLTTPIGSQYFPGAPIANRGKAIPILIGRNTDVEALQIVGDAAGTLALTLSSSATELYMAEIGATFPDAGTVTVGSETGVTYTSRDLITVSGITYLRLSGLTRGAPVTQNAGDAVTLTNITYTYLVGYESGEVTAVRAGGVLVDPADYTVATDAASADRTVTVVEFSSEPTAPVRIDADGINVLVDSEITNGGFETGDKTGWTEVGSASLTVSTGDTTDAASTYKGELTGSEEAWEDMYADFATVAGRYYTVEFDYRDNTVSNLLTNADFSDGLTGWTLSAESVNGQASPQAGGGETGDVALGSVNGTHFTYQTLLYQDVTTTVSADYTLTFSYRGYRSHSGVGASGATGGSTLTRGGYRVGTPADEDLYDALAASDDIPWPPGTMDTWRTVTVSFTATTTTTRITFEGLGSNDRYVLWPLYVRDILLTQTTSLPTSTTGYKLGTATDDDALADVTLTPRYSWQRVQMAFQALLSETRLTLRSQWTGLSADSWFDNVRLRDGGRNPADAIAYVVDSFLAPDIVRDEDAFNTAYDKLREWQFGGVLASPGDSRALLDDMAWQCNSRVVIGASGQLRLLVRDGIPSDTLPILGVDNIVDRTLRVRREPMDNIYTDYVIWFGRTSDDDDDQQAFQAQVSASPSGTTHPSAPLAELCQAARSVYGSARLFERRAGMVRDLRTAHLLLQKVVERHTERHLDISLRALHQGAIQLEVGDYVQIFHPRVKSGDLYLCEVLSKDVGTQDVGLRLRTVAPVGFYESWDFPLTLIEGEAFVEPWEA